MKVAYQHEVTTSFVLWFDHFLLSKGEAFKNLTSTFYPQVDARLPNNVIYASPHKQWVTDSSIAGATIPNGVYNDGVFVPRGTSGLKLDFENGRAILNSGFSSSANITGTFALKDFNIYVTDQNEEDLIIESNHKINSRFFRENAGIPPYDQVVPAIFISNDGSKNNPFAFGGEDKTTTYFKAAVIAENLYTLDGVLSIFNDSSRTIFSKIDFEDHPMNEFGDFKNGSKVEISIPNLTANRWHGNHTYQYGGTFTIKSYEINSQTKFSIIYSAAGSNPSFNFDKETNVVTISYPRYAEDRTFFTWTTTGGTDYISVGTDPSLRDIINFINSQPGFTASTTATEYNTFYSIAPPGLSSGEYYPVDDVSDIRTYNYETLAEKTKQDYFLIESVSCSRMSDNLRKVVLDNLFVGFIDFEVAQTRFPRL